MIHQAFGIKYKIALRTTGNGGHIQSATVRSDMQGGKSRCLQLDFGPPQESLCDLYCFIVPASCPLERNDYRVKAGHDNCAFPAPLRI